MADAHKNFPYSTVVTAPSPATSGTSMVLAAGGGALMPEVPFNMTVWPVSVQPLASNAEIVQVTLIATDTLTIVRQQEGTSARTIVVGDQVAATITAKSLTDMEGNRLPTADMRVKTGFGTLVIGDLEIATGKIYELEANSVLEIT